MCALAGLSMTLGSGLKVSKTLTISSLFSLFHTCGSSFELSAAAPGTMRSSYHHGLWLSRIIGPNQLLPLSCLGTGVSAQQ